jgi:HlyD family secretion protein
MKTFFSMFVILGLVAAAASSGYWAVGFEEHNKFRTAAIRPGDLEIVVSTTGTVEPVETVDVGAQVAGRIKSFGVDPKNPNKTIDYGTHVEQGTVLAQIDDSLYAIAVQQAQTNLQRAEAVLSRARVQQSQAERNWRRVQDLGQAMSAMDRDNYLSTNETAKVDVQVSEAEVAQAKAALRQAEVNLDYTTIRSPVKGTIIDRRVDVGQTVVASLNAPSLFLLAKDLTRMQVWASVNEADIGRIHRGQDVAFTVDAYPQLTLHGKVAQIRLNATMSQNVVTYTVVVDVDNHDEKLLPYMTANLRFELDRRQNVLLVPNQAMSWQPTPEQIAPVQASSSTKTSTPAFDQGRTGTIWVKAGETQVRPVTVRVGVSDGIQTELLDTTLTPDTEVVIGEIEPSDSGKFGPAFVPKSRNPWNNRKDSS